MNRVIKNIHLKNTKIFLVLFSSLMFGACTQSSSNIDESDDTNDTVIVDTEDSTDKTDTGTVHTVDNTNTSDPVIVDTDDSTDTTDPVIIDTNDTVESNETITYFDINFPIDGVDYSKVSVDDRNMSSGARQLAAQCAQCHGTYGVAVADWPDLWGPGRSIGKWMQDYQSIEDYKDNVMHMHAVTYSTEEVQLMKEYYENVTYTGGL